LQPTITTLPPPPQVPLKPGVASFAGEEDEVIIAAVPLDRCCTAADLVERACDIGSRCPANVYLAGLWLPDGGGMPAGTSSGSACAAAAAAAALMLQRKNAFRLVLRRMVTLSPKPGGSSSSGSGSGGGAPASGSLTAAVFTTATWLDDGGGVAAGGDHPSRVRGSQVRRTPATVRMVKAQWQLPTAGIHVCASLPGGGGPLLMFSGSDSRPLNASIPMLPLDAWLRDVVVALHRCALVHTPDASGQGVYSVDTRGMPRTPLLVVDDGCTSDVGASHAQAGCDTVDAALTLLSGTVGTVIVGSSDDAPASVLAYAPLVAVGIARCLSIAIAGMVAMGARSTGHFVATSRSCHMPTAAAAADGSGSGGAGVDAAARSELPPWLSTLAVDIAPCTTADRHGSLVSTRAHLVAAAGGDDDDVASGRGMSYTAAGDVIITATPAGTLRTPITTAAAHGAAHARPGGSIHTRNAALVGATIVVVLALLLAIWMRQ
jgi:hypothetical protein